jgi:hypothetical protein
MMSRPPEGSPRSFSVRAVLTAVCLITTAGCRGGCLREDGGATGRGVLARFPAETQVVVSLDFERIRQTALWKRLSALAAEDPGDKKLIEEFTTRTGLDPFRQLHRLVAAFPEEARGSGAFGIVIEGEDLDEKRLLTYARDQAKLRGAELQPKQHAGYTLWHTGAPDGTAGFFLDRRRFVLGGGGWAEKMADLARAGGSSSGSAQSNPTLLRLVDRLGVRRAIWMAALVPDQTRRNLQADPRFGVQASVMRFGAGLDLGPGLRGQVDAELSNAADARALVDKFDTFLRAARKSPQALLIGAGPYLDGITSKADGPRALIGLELSETQTLELVNRAVGLLRLQREKK